MDKKPTLENERLQNRSDAGSTHWDAREIVGLTVFSRLSGILKIKIMAIFSKNICNFLARSIAFNSI